MRAACPGGSRNRGRTLEHVEALLVLHDRAATRERFGPPARIRERYRAWEDSGADALTVRSRQPEAIEVMAQAAGLRPAAA